MKLAPVHKALESRQALKHLIVHTGQHYDYDMSAAFFKDLGIPAPDVDLGVGAAPHGRQTGAIMSLLEPVCESARPDVVLVYGDVNSTLAGALVAAKLGIPVGHVEAGLRSRDWSMPEEVNRVVADRVSSLLFVPSRDAIENLHGEGIAPDRIEFIGNVMIDTLVKALPSAHQFHPASGHGLKESEYTVVTLHRPSNVDDRDRLTEILCALDQIAAFTPIVFPVHPRTRARLSAFGFSEKSGRIVFCDPLPYSHMLSLVARAGLVITDSGGLQEETTFLGIPCLTLRPNTERPITCSLGTNRLISTDPVSLVAATREVLRGAQRGPPPAIERWDGHAAERLVAVLCDGAHFR